MCMCACCRSYHGPTSHSPPKFPFTFGVPSSCPTRLAGLVLAASAAGGNMTRKPVATLAGVTAFNVTTGQVQGLGVRGVGFRV